MEILLVAVVVIGICFALIGLAFIMDDEVSGVFPLLMGVVLLVGGILALHDHDHQSYIKTRAAIYHDLHAQHWNIKLNEVSGSNETVRLGCLTLNAQKLDGKWFLTVPRSERSGGGSKILDSSKEQLLRKVC